jgi:hypothetical protein
VSAAGVREAALLRGRTEPWRRVELAALAAFVAVGLWLRLRGLSAEGFADDEIHKWLAANRYVHGDFSGDDAEHPMLMKSLIALALLAGRHLGWAPETITRLPNALGGGACVLALAFLGRRLFGRAVGLTAAALSAVSVTLVGYQRVAKEDTLLGLFMIVVCQCTAEAKAAAEDGRAEQQRRWELGAAAAAAAMFATKYYIHYPLVPVLFYLWVRRGSAWRIPTARWGVLIGVTLAVWVVLNWTPLLPATWAYVPVYLAGGDTLQGSMFFMGHIYDSLAQRGPFGTPPWYYLVFTAVKLAPVTLVLAVTGLAVALHERLPAHRLLLSWLGLWFVAHSVVLGGKFGRYYTSALPAILLLAACAAVLLVERARRHGAAAVALAGALTLVLVADEARAAVEYAPHYRLYISALGGGGARVNWYFPHCDYFDAGYREAMEYIGARAEQGAEVSSELAYHMKMPDYVPSRFYVEGRDDLLHTLPRQGRGCVSGRVCYVVVQVGRRYFHNEKIVANLAQRAPWYVVQIRGLDAVRVYRLEAGEQLPAD